MNHVVDWMNAVRHHNIPQESMMERRERNLLGEGISGPHVPTRQPAAPGEGEVECSLSSRQLRPATEAGLCAHRPRACNASCTEL